MNSGNKATGMSIIKSFTAQELRELYCKEDLVEDYEMLRDMLHSGDTTNKEKVEIIKALWEFTVQKPARQTELSGADGAPLTINLVKYGDNSTV